MNKQLQQLAYRNVKKYKKHYLFSSLLMLFITIFFLSYFQIWHNHYEVQKLYNQEYYGTWYCKGYVDVNNKEIWEKQLNKIQSIRYAYIYRQGETDEGYQIGHVQDDIYEFCHLQLMIGEYPKNDYQIMISKKMQKELNLQLHQKIELMIQNHQDNYEITGIIQNSQDNIFLDIYTNKETYDEIEIFINQPVVIKLGEDTSQEIGAKYDQTNINQYGYSGNPSQLQIQMSIDSILLLAETLLLTLFVLIALNLSYLKRRNKDFVLLRGIGMTNKQLISMVMYEVLYTLLLSVIFGVILSFGVTYIASLYLEKQYHYFVYSFSLGTFLLNVIILVCLVFLSMLYPVASSAKTALSGSFDSQKFQYIQVRYRQLKYQKKWRIALRELKVQKRMTISLFILLSFLSLLYVVSIVDPNNQNGLVIEDKKAFDSFHYYSESSYDKESVKEIYDKYKEQSYIYTSYNKELNINNDQYNTEHQSIRVIAIEDQTIFKHCRIEGRLPKNKYEIIISLHSSHNDERERSINDTFMYQGEEYIIVGILYPNETITKTLDGIEEVFDLYFAPDECIYVNKETFQLWNTDQSQIFYEIRTFYTDEDKKEINRQFQSTFNNIPWSSDEGLETHAENEEIELLLELDSRLLIAPVIISFIFLYYLNKNQMMNDSQDIALYKLIGMTNQDLMKKQFYKALIMILMILCFEIFWMIMLDIYYGMIYIPFRGLMISVIVLFVVCTFIYCYPLKEILQDNVFDLIKGDE